MTVQTETICFPDGSFVIKTVRGKHRPASYCPEDYYTTIKSSYSDDGTIPILSSVSPRKINPHGRISWNLTVYGDRFDATSKIYFDGQEVPTAVHSPTKLTAYLLVPGANLKLGQHIITVTTKGASESYPLILMAVTPPPVQEHTVSTGGSVIAGVSSTL